MTFTRRGDAVNTKCEGYWSYCEFSICLISIIYQVQLALRSEPRTAAAKAGATARRRSLPGLVITLKELAELGIGFVSLTEAFDMTTPTGRALAGMLAVFAEFEREILRERVKAGIAQARIKGTTFGRPKSAAKKIAEIKRLYRKEKLTK
jgi:hypothetical protein